MMGLNETLEKIHACSMLVFDFDGVLADSVEVKTEAFAALYADYGDEVRKKVIDHHRANGGMSRYEKFRFYHENFLNKKIDEKEIERLADQFSSLVVDKVVSSPEIAGAERFLKKYCADTKVAVVNSATPTDEIREIVKRRGLSDYFKTVVGSPETKSDNLQYLMSLHNMSAEECVFFGDAVTDLDAAKARSVFFIGIGESIKRILEKEDEEFFAVKDFNLFLG